MSEELMREEYFAGERHKLYYHPPSNEDALPGVSITVGNRKVALTFYSEDMSTEEVKKTGHCLFEALKFAEQQKFSPGTNPCKEY